MAQRNKVGHYDIVAELGRGGMGVVYKGFEASLNRHVAIKMLSESLAGDASVVERFFREARSMAQLNDPHIVQIYLVGEDQGQPFFAMEFVEGESLSQRLKRDRRLDPPTAARILLQVAQGLATAHDRGVIHRDIKPANLLITQRGHVKVADFGIALASSDANQKLTGTGQFVGTPGYLSPEVCLGKPVDQRSDIFALGIVFFEMLTGETPFKDESPLGMMLEVVQAEIPDVRAVNSAIDPRYSAILRRMVAKDPADRYADCHQLVADLVTLGIHGATPVPQSQPALGPVVGTVVNTPTPAEIKQLSPKASVGYGTQPSLPAIDPLGAAPAAAAAKAPGRKRSMLPWAAAVLALVGTGGAAAWYLGGAGSQASADSPSAQIASLVAAATNASVALIGGSGTASSAQGSSDAPLAAVSDALTAASVATEQAQATTESIGDALAAAVAANPEMLLELDDEGDAPGARADTADLGQSPQSAAIGARLSELRERRLERREAIAERVEAELAPPVQGPRAETVRVASATPAPAAKAAPVYRGPPRVVVLAFGDPAVAGVVDMAIAERIAETGMDLVDADLIPALAQLKGDREPDLTRLMNSAGRHAEYVITVRVVPLGQQQLTFYGESMTQYSARLQVSAYDTRSQRKLGAGWQTQVSFTHLNADPNTRQAIAPYLGRIVAEIGGNRRG